MVKIYNNVGQAYVKGYGRVPVRYYGDGYGEVAYTSAKHLGKYAFPVLKKVWGSLNRRCTGLSTLTQLIQPLSFNTATAFSTA